MFNFLLKRHVVMVLTTTIFFSFVDFSIAKGKDVGKLTDGRMEGAIERRLDMDSRIQGDSIGVSVQDGHVKLFGTVDTLHEYGHATQVASSVLGVQSVNNTIEIRPQPTQDQQLKNNIAQRLERLELLNGDKVDVRVAKKVVTLMGTVPSQVALREVAHVAESVKGVRKVENLLTVEGAGRSDDAILEDVKHYILWSPLANLGDFHVGVNQGVVTLEGTVENLVHKDVLVMDIEHIHGVRNVRVGKVIPERVEVSLKDS